MVLLKCEAAAKRVSPRSLDSSRSSAWCGVPRTARAAWWCHPVTHRPPAAPPPARAGSGGARHTPAKHKSQLPCQTLGVGQHGECVN